MSEFVASVAVRLGIGWDQVLGLSFERVDELLRQSERERAKRDADLLVFMTMSNTAAQGSKKSADEIGDILDRLNETINGREQ